MLPSITLRFKVNILCGSKSNSVAKKSDDPPAPCRPPVESPALQVPSAARHRDHLNAAPLHPFSRKAPTRQRQRQPTRSLRNVEPERAGSIEEHTLRPPARCPPSVPCCDAAWTRRRGSTAPGTSDGRWTVRQRDLREALTSGTQGKPGSVQSPKSRSMRLSSGTEPTCRTSPVDLPRGSGKLDGQARSWSRTEFGADRRRAHAGSRTRRRRRDAPSQSACARSLAHPCQSGSPTSVPPWPRARTAVAPLEVN